MSQVISIKDISADVVEEMIFFIYTGKTPNLDKMATDLLGAAEQYQLEMLKNICHEELGNTLEINNSIDRLILGDFYQVTTLPHQLILFSTNVQADKLKMMAMKFVVRNITTLMQSTDLEESLVDNPSLMAEVMKEMAKNCNCNCN